MEECTICGENAEYKCTPCNIVLCKIHKHDHKRMEQSEHLIIKIAKNLSLEKNPIFMDNFLMKESQSKEVTHYLLIHLSMMRQCSTNHCSRVSNYPQWISRILIYYLQ